MNIQDKSLQNNSCAIQQFSDIPIQLRNRSDRNIEQNNIKTETIQKQDHPISQRTSNNNIKVAKDQNQQQILQRKYNKSQHAVNKCSDDKTNDKIEQVTVIKADNQQQIPKENKSEECNQKNKQQIKQESGITKNKQDQEQIEKIHLKPLKSSSTFIRKFKNRSKNQSSFNDSMEIEKAGEQKYADKSTIKRKLSNAIQKIQQDKDISMLDMLHKLDNATTDLRGQINYKAQNKKLKNKVTFLMVELKNLEARLNKELSKRAGSNSNKQRVHSMQNISNRQLQNADQRCRIYKKQIQSLKQKNSIFNEQKINTLTGELSKLKQTALDLEAENKQLQKTIKKYEKMIDGIDDGKYIKLRQQLDSLKSQNRKLKQKIKKQQQDERLQQISVSNQRKKNRRQIQQQQQQRKKQQIRQQKQINILKSKSERDDRKIKVLSFQTTKNKQRIQNLQNELHMKNKQIDSLKQIIKNQRKLIGVNKRSRNKNIEQSLNSNQNIETTQQKKQQIVTIQNNNKHQNQNKIDKKNDISSQKLESQNAKRQQEIKKMQQKVQQPSEDKKQINECQKKREQQQEKLEQQIKIRGRYPRMVEKGETSSQSYKWNHHIYASKIKQVQVMPHANGHIKCINFRYQKGEPAKIEQGPYASFVCDENGGQFIKKIEGGFKNGLLQYIRVATNKKRQSTFCKHQIAQECHNFSFGTEESEYPGAMFGEFMNESITKIGCFIQSLGQK